MRTSKAGVSTERLGGWWRSAVVTSGIIFTGHPVVAAAMPGVPKAAPTAVKSPDNGVFDVQAFGAKGDGVTDDTAAVQRAVDAACRVTGGIVLFSRGTYALRRAGEREWAITATNCSWMRLQGTLGATIIGAGDIGKKQIGLFYFFGVERIEILELDIIFKVTGDPPTRRNAYIFNFSPDPHGRPCRDVEMSRNRLSITHPLGSNEVRAMFGVYFYGGEQGPNWRSGEFAFDDNVFQDSEGRHVETWNSEHVRISRNRFLNCGPISSATVIRMIGSVREVLVEDNFVELSATGRLSSYAVVWGAGGSPSTGWQATPADGGLIQGNMIIAKGGTAKTKQIGIFVEGGRRALFSANYISQRNDVAHSGIGIRLDRDPKAGSNSDLTFVNNKIVGWNDYAVQNTDPGASHIQLYDNDFGSPSASALSGMSLEISDPHNVLDTSHGNYFGRLSTAVKGNAGPPR